MTGNTQGDALIGSAAFRTSILSAEPKDFIDPFFDPQVVGNTTAAAIQPDGKILLSGNFTQINGLEAKDLVRFNRDGSIDPTFKFDHQVFNDVNAASILSILVLPGGKILIGGDFDRVIRLKHIPLLV